MEVDAFVAGEPALDLGGRVGGRADGVGRGEDAADRQIGVTIDYLGGDIATFTCLSHRSIDLLHLIRLPEGWRIVYEAWGLR